MRRDPTNTVFAQVVDEVSVRSTQPAMTSHNFRQPVLSTDPARKAFVPPGASKAVNPLAVRVAALSASPERARRESQPSPLENAARFALPAPFKIPARAPRSEPAAGSTRSVPRKSGPKFDPNAEGALVMRRPDDEHEKEYNKKCVGVAN